MVHGLMLGLIVFGALSSFFISKTFPFSTGHSSPITGLSVPSLGAAPSQATVLTSQVLPNTVRREQMQQAMQAFAGQAPAGAVTASAAATAAVVKQDPYQLYTVADGDTASAIASRFGVDLRYLLWANPDLRDGEFLTVGQQLVVPAGNGIVHQVRYGETLSDIAARYGVTVDQILAWQGNGIASADSVLEDQTVFVPGGVEPAIAQPTPVATEPPVAVVAAPAAPAPAPASSEPSSSHGLIWPVVGPISSYMGPSHPLGIDIDMYANPNGPIVAATSGTVTFAGGDPCCSYGLHVIIMSPDGIETLYGHMSVVGVTQGQQVSQGDFIGNVGCTGYCTGNHVHFEVIDNGVRVDPLTYLP